MIRTDKRLRLSKWVIALLLFFIWGNSLLPGEISGAISDWVKNLLAVLLPGEVPGVTTGGGLLRKLAHFLEFAMLGASLTWLGSMAQRRKIWPLCCGCAAACVDETIQLFVPDRGPSLKDVALDTCGVAAGMMVLLIGHSLLTKHKMRRS